MSNINCLPELCLLVDNCLAQRNKKKKKKYITEFIKQIDYIVKVANLQNIPKQSFLIPHETKQ